MNETVHNEFEMNLLENPVFSLDEKNAESLRGIFKPKTISKDDFFLQVGAHSTEIGYILKGVFRSFYIDQNGHDVTKYFHAQNESIFSYYAYLSQTKSKYSIQALEDSEILVTHISEFEKVVEGNYQLLLFYKKMVDAMHVKKEKHASSFTLLSSTQRYQQFLTDYPGIEERIKQYQLASYLGITPVTLSRIRKKLNLIK
jgi:CRP-like cAMP-binding protein